MAESAKSPRRRLRLVRLARMLLPSLATLALAILLVFTIIFTEFDWEWVAFLGGVLFAAVLSLVSASWKAEWRMARRAAETARFKERFAMEAEQHRRTAERLTREMELHHQDRELLAREKEARSAAEQQSRAAQNILFMLERQLPVIAFYVDHDLRYRFHTKAFSAWTGKSSASIDGRPFQDPLAPLLAEALRAPLERALRGEVVRTELHADAAKRDDSLIRADFVPHRDASNRVSGVMVVFGEEAISLPEAGVTESGTGIRVSDERGHEIYLNSLTEDLAASNSPWLRIREAIEKEDFDLYVQDIVSLRPDTAPGGMLELLIRMRSEEKNLIPPGAFLPIAERFELMPDIDRWVVRKAVEAGIAARAAGRGGPPVYCVNIARSSFLDRSFPGSVAGVLQANKARGESICFEVSDADAIGNLADASRFMHELKPLGCRFSLEGFGATEVDFEHVKSLPLDFIKIDGRIILEICRNPIALAKVRAIQRVCRVIGMRTIAEFVETDDVLQTLRSLQVDYAQGFGIASPHLLEPASGVQRLEPPRRQGVKPGLPSA